MKLYLDDDSTDHLLVRLLQRAGHDVEIPADAGLMGREDPVHLAHAIDEDRVCLTGNHDDFVDLHNLIGSAKGNHPGILIVRRDNDRRRDLTPHGIVQAIANLEASSVEIRDTVHILNHWR